MVSVRDSILLSTKKNIGGDIAETHFDPDILMHINTTLSRLTQLGVGPLGGLSVEDEETTWADFYGDDPRLHMVKSFVTLSVRLIFDPPTTGYTLDSIQKQIDKYEWLLSVAVEPVVPEAPIPTVPVPNVPINPPGDFIIDGGDLDPD